MVAVVASGAKGSRQEKLYSFVVAAGFAAELLGSRDQVEMRFTSSRLVLSCKILFDAE